MRISMPTTQKLFSLLSFSFLLFSSSSLVAQETNCQDGIDNDGNGLIDCFDPSCDCYTCDNNQGNIWALQSGTTIDFGGKVPSVTNSTSFFSAIEGSATVADPNGNLLFYTNGNDVWDKNNNMLPAPTGGPLNLGGGNSSINPAVVIPNPGNLAEYFIVTTGDALLTLNGTQLATINFGLPNNNNGNGAITSANTPLIPFASSTEKLLVVRSANCRDYWLITHDYDDQSGNNTFANPGNNYVAYRIDINGLNTNPVISPQTNGVTHQLQPGGFFAQHRMKQGEMAISPDQTIIANAVNTTNQIEAGLFDANTGQVAIITTLALPNNEEVWGLEFSPDGQFLYASTLSNNVYRFSLGGGAAQLVFSGTAFIGQLKVAPNGHLYITEQSNDLIEISNPNEPNVNNLIIGRLPNTAGGNGLPYTIPNFCQPEIDLAVNPNPACAGQPIFATANITNGAAVSANDYDYAWNTGTVVNDIFTAPNTLNTTMQTTAPTSFSPIYEISVSDFYGCTAAASIAPQILQGPNVSVTATDLNVCPDEPTTLIATSTSGRVSFAWSDAGGYFLGSGSSITVYPSGTTTYTVTVTDANGCTSSQQITITVEPLDFPFLYVTPFSRDQAPDICTDIHENLFTVSTFRGEAEIHNAYYPNTCSQSQSVIAKYNRCDALEWTYELPYCMIASLSGPGLNGHPDIIDTDFSNHLYVLVDATLVNGTITFGTSTITNNGFYILKFLDLPNSTAPVPQSARFVSNTSAIGLTIDNNQDILVLHTEPNGAALDHRVSKFEGASFPSPSIWTTTITNTTTNNHAINARDIVTNSNNEVIVIGTTDNMTFPNPSLMYAANLDGNLGSVNWYQTFGNGQSIHNSALDVVVNSNDDIIIAGYELATTGTNNVYLASFDRGGSLNAFTTFPSSAGSVTAVTTNNLDDIFLATGNTLRKFDVTGSNLLWALPTPGNIFMYDVAMKPHNDHVYLSNLMRGSVTLNGITLNSTNGGTDIMISRVEDQSTSGIYAQPNVTNTFTETTNDASNESVFGTNNIDLVSNNLDINIYPNPTSSVATLDILNADNDEITSIEVLDIHGRTVQQVYHGNASQTQYTIDMNTYSAGVYIVRVTSNTQTVAKKITLVK